MSSLRLLASAISITLAFSTTALAQDAAPRPRTFGVDAAVVLPVGDYGEIATLAIGALARVEIPLAANLSITGRAGAIYHIMDADLDGASWFSKWRHITVPLLRPTTLYLIVIYTILAFQLFERVYIMTNGGGPNNATITIVQLIYSTAFQFGRYGLASAMAVVLFVMALVVAVVQFRSLRSDVEY